MFNRFFSYLFPSSGFSKERKNRLIQTNNARELASYGYDLNLVPDELCCKITFEIMDNPVIIDSRTDRDGSLIIEHDHVIDRSTLEELSKVPTSGIIDPFTKKPIRTVRDLPELKLKIELFVLTNKIIYLHKQSLAPEECEIEYRDNEKKLLEIGVRQHHVPEEFISRHLNKKILSFPVMINNNHIVEFRDLIEWWETNRNFPQSPCEPVGYPVKSIQLHDDLYQRINLFISACEHRPIDETTWSSILQNIAFFNRFNRQTAHQRLVAKNFPLDRVPQEFILSNFNGMIITHPIRIDNDFVVDFDALVDWWNQSSKNKSFNFFTGKRVKSIVYDVDLKRQIDLFLENTELYLESGILVRNHSKLVSWQRRQQTGLLFFRSAAFIPAEEEKESDLLLYRRKLEE